jgi:hypothetical protein
MTIPTRQPARIAVFGGSFVSQQLTFAHLLDAADRAGVVLEMERVDVLQGDGLARRLAHYFDDPTVRAILGAATGCDTLVLLTRPGDLPAENTAHLRWLGIFPGHLVRALPERPC